MKPSRKWFNTAEAYRYFGRLVDGLDWSDAAALAMYRRESTGVDTTAADNGFALGKSRMDLMVTMWTEDLTRGLVCKHEFYSDPELPSDWLRSWMPKLVIEPTDEWKAARMAILGRT